MIILIDDSPIILEMLKMGLSGRNVHAFDSMSAFMDSNVSRETCSVVVTDWQLPDTSDPVKSVRSISEAPIVLISGASQSVLDSMTFDDEPNVRISKDAGLPAIIEIIVGFIEQ